MKDPFANSTHQIGQTVDTAKLDYVTHGSGKRKIPRARFYLAQEREFSIDSKHRGRDTIALPCEIHGSRAEDFVRSVGKNSWIYIQGWLRTYDMNGRYPKMRIVVTFWSVLKHIMPLRGIGKRKSIPDVPAVPGLPEDGEPL